MKQNVASLLRARGFTAKALALWCGRKESWISKILTEPSRDFPLKYWDRMANFLGVSAYQLLQPGLSSLTERRSGTDRRTIKERRVSAGHRAMLPAMGEVETHRPRRHVVAEAHRLTHEFESQLAALLQTATDAGHQDSTPGRTVAQTRRHPRDDRGPRAKTGRRD